MNNVNDQFNKEFATEDSEAFKQGVQDCKDGNRDNPYNVLTDIDSHRKWVYGHSYQNSKQNCSFNDKRRG